MSSKETSNAALDYIAQIHRAVHAVGLFIDAEFGPEVSQPEALVLILLLGAGPATINDVHRAFLHRRSTLTSVLDRLEKKRYVVREASASDRRSIRLSLTKTGRGLARRVAAALEERCHDVQFAAPPARLISTLESTALTFYGI
ncbi:MAG TPA: MarR family transcriptional regulator [Candidatus Baltobacteraceae bacterium]|jgi:DNA-binding MarR family transcriptional regulator|nr:MarR family transcriptional regulator [Candidatus Baltobacteraceae bacterium]